MKHSIRHHLFLTVFLLAMSAVLIYAPSLSPRTASASGIFPQQEKKPLPGSPITQPTLPVDTKQKVAPKPNTSYDTTSLSVPVASFDSGTAPSLAVLDAPVVLYDQTSNPSTSSTGSQNFEPSLDAFDDELADDFVVPGGQMWNIQQVNVRGSYSGPGSATSVNVVFYNDSGTLPGTAQCTYTNLPMTDSAGNFNILLPVPCILSSGTHWVSVQANENFTPSGQWFWLDRAIQSNSGAAWRNPGGGLGVGCTTFGRRTTCVDDAASPDQIFQLLGTSGFAVLYDQTSNPSTASTGSQNFEPSLDAFDDELADDFVVPGGQTWNVQQVNVQGEYSGPGSATSVNVVFYNDSGTLPGTAQCTYTNMPMTDSAGNFNILLPVPCALSSGTHWVSVQANENFTPNGQWFWLDRAIQSNSGAAWRNPGGGHGVGCITFGRRTTCVGHTASPDQIFQLLGSISSGPSITPAGSTLVNESCPPVNGAVDPGETDTITLRLTNNGSISTTSLTATLQSSPNLLAPSGPQNYGALGPGATAGRNFSFTANGSCGDVITLTLQLQDGPMNLGTVNYSIILGCNTACQGVPRIGTSATLACNGTNTVASITVTNTGTATANNVVLTTAKLGGVSGAPLPQNLGNLAPGASTTANVTFSDAPRGITTLQIGGNHNVGSFSGNRKVTAPACP